MKKIVECSICFQKRNKITSPQCPVCGGKGKRRRKKNRNDKKNIERQKKIATTKKMLEGKHEEVNAKRMLFPHDKLTNSHPTGNPYFQSNSRRT